MRLASVVSTWSAVRSTRSRKKKIDLLAATLREAGSDLPIVATWLSGELVHGRIGVGYRMLQTCRDDAGPAPEASSLTVTELHLGFGQIAAESGKGATARRLEHLSNLYVRATAPERQFLLELISGEVRQGAQEGVLLEAIALGIDVPVDLVRRGFMLSGTIRDVATTAFHQGAEGLAAYRVRPFTALRPMLAQTAASPAQALVLLGGDAWFDVKVDGVRVQIHRDGARVKVYTRHLHEVGAMVPEVVEAALAYPWQRCIVDAEAIALDADGRPLPFQVTMRRFGRTTDVEGMRKALPLSTLAFDLLLADETELLDEPAVVRFVELDRLPPEQRVRRARIIDADDADRFYGDAIDEGHEGIMAKAPQGLYQAGARGNAWLKIKPAHTLDLVVLAAEWGSGRRQGWLSNLHLGAPDANGRLQMLGKTFKGLTDAMLAWQTEHLQQLALEQDGYLVTVRPSLVVEIAFNDVQASPHYPSGIALRFARVKGYRLDKTPAQADSFESVRALLPDGL